MTGRQILEAVRLKINDHTYDSFGEIDEAFRWMCRKASFNFLRVVDELITFEADTSEYFINVSNMRRIERLWVYGVDDGEQWWHELTETTPEMFETYVHENRDTSGSDDTDRPIHYKIEGGPNAKITITPTPDQSYNSRVDYLQYIPAISRDTQPQTPPAYDDIIIDKASSLILEKSKNEADIMLATKYEARSIGLVQNLISDTHPNRTKNINRPSPRWLK